MESGWLLSSARGVLVPEGILPQTLGPQWGTPNENGGEFQIGQRGLSTHVNPPCENGGEFLNPPVQTNF